MKIFFQLKTLLCCSCSGSLGHPVLLIWQSQFLCLLRKELPFNPESLMYCTKVCLLFVPVSPQNIEQGLSWDWSLRNLCISSFHACTFSFSSVHTNFPRVTMHGYHLSILILIFIFLGVMTICTPPDQMCYWSLCTSSTVFSPRKCIIFQKEENMSCIPFSILLPSFL